MLLKHDPLHSQVEFKIKHLMISRVRGSFEEFQVRIETRDSTFNASKVECEIEVASIKTQIKDRDDHLKSPDFFDVENHPKIVFKSTSVNQKSSNTYEMVGMLSIKGVEKPIVLNVLYNGSDQDQYGQTKYGFEITGAIKRSDWELDFNVLGGRDTLLIGNEVKIEANIQMMRV